MKVYTTHYQTSILFLLLIFNVLLSTAQDNTDNIEWSKVYSDKLYFSKIKENSVILFARKDTMIEVWINGIKDTADYSEGSSVDFYESWESGMMYGLYAYPESEELSIDSRRTVGIGVGSEGNYYVPEIDVPSLRSTTLYSCADFIQMSPWSNLAQDKSPELFAMLFNTVYYLRQIDDEKCNDCAISILEDVIRLLPNRTLAYLNLADAYWSNNNKIKANENYLIYVNQMKANGEQINIPQCVLDRANEK